MLHQTAGRLLGLDIEYELLDVPTAQVAETIRALRDGEWDGFNVTAPHKLVAMDLVDGASERARRVGAVNTLLMSDGCLRGENTDWVGFEALLTDIDCSNALVLGAGGAARVVVDVLEQRGLVSMGLCNRTLANAQIISDKVPRCRALSFTDAPALIETVDLVVNCLPEGARTILGPEFFRALSPQTWVLDLAYGPTAKNFRRNCVPHHARFRDGLDMLIVQGAKAFQLWTGRCPNIPMLRAALGKYATK